MPAGFEDDGFLARFLAEKGRALAAAAPPRLWAPGRRVGEWRITAFLARGGSSEAYCARHVRLGTPAVLKVLWRDEEAPRARFARETAFLMGSPDPAFPAFYGTGEEDGRPWMAMESLGEAPLPEKDADAARYLADVAHGVAVLHARGWVHRDLKPRNILVRESDGHAVLIDFGLLKPVEEGEKEVASGSGLSVVDGRAVGVGTPGFAAPEQFAGGETTPAADVYALGMLAEACFGGKPPRAWNRIIRRATAALPRQRYRDAAAFLRAVRRRHWRRNICIAALTLAVVAAAVWASQRLMDSPRFATAQAESAREAAVEHAQKGPGEEIVENILQDLVPLPVPEGFYASDTWFRLADGECLLARHEVTQAQWEAIMGSNPSQFPGPDRPVDGVTFAECLEFAGRLNRMPAVRKAGVRFRLPTRAEWELAVEAGGDEPHDVDDLLAVGWFAGNSGKETHPVGKKGENGLGFFDLYGNVAECTASPVCIWGNTVDAFECVGGSCLQLHYPGTREDFVGKLGAFDTLPEEFKSMFGELHVAESAWKTPQPGPRLKTALRGNLPGLRLCADRMP